MSLLDDALALAERGWPIVWLRERSKAPVTPHGIRDASVDPDVIRRWGERWPSGNIGVACGAPGPDVLDLDDVPGAGDVADRCRVLDVPVVATSRGRQYYFAGSTLSTIEFSWGELRRRGSYVVAPPSIHPSGKSYTWILAPNGALPRMPDGLVPERSGAGAGEAPHCETVEPGAMYAYLLDLAVRLVRAGQSDTGVIEAMLLTAFKVKRMPGMSYSGGPDDTRRIARWAVQSEIAGRERAASGSRFSKYRDLRHPPPEGDPSAVEGVRFTVASSVRAERVKWLVPKLVPLGGVTMLAGDPKVGKSAWTCLIGALVSRGKFGGGPGTVGFASAEDTLAHVIKPRLHAAGADLDLVGTLAVQEGEGARGLVLPDDVGGLDAFVAETGARLLILDPLNAFLAGSVDSWKDAGIRAALAPLALLAEVHGIAVIIVVHLNKQLGGNPLYRPGGSIGYVGAARSLLTFGRDPEDPDGERGRRRLLGHLGGNWGAQAPTRAYELEPVTVELDGSVIDTVRLRYVGESDADASAAFGGRVREDRSGDAEEAIAEQLADLQPHPSRTVKSAVMAELDVSEPTVKRAAKRMVDRGELIVHERGAHLGPGQARRSTEWQLSTGITPVGSSPITNDEPTSEPPMNTGDSTSGITDGNGGVDPTRDDSTDGDSPITNGVVIGQNPMDTGDCDNDTRDSDTDGNGDVATSDAVPDPDLALVRARAREGELAAFERRLEADRRARP